MNHPGCKEHPKPTEVFGFGSCSCVQKYLHLVLVRVYRSICIWFLFVCPEKA